MGADRLVVDVMDAGVFELELELIQTQNGRSVDNVMDADGLVVDAMDVGVFAPSLV
jgi:hypothetical protein